MKITISESSLKEFYWSLTSKPVSEMYVQMWPDIYARWNWFEEKLYIDKFLRNSWDEWIIKLIYKNISWFDKWYTEFYFRYLQTKLEIVSAIYSKKPFEWKLVWSKDIVEKWEETVIYLKVRKK